MNAQWLINGRADAATIVLAHGAGATMDSPFMEAMAAGLAESGFRVVRFEFPYMAQRRTGGASRPPDKEPVLRRTWLAVIEALGPQGLIIGGKSMGGRMASLVADEARVAGLICFGYPFHPTGKPDRLRIEHLQQIRTPTLILQGERDPFGTRQEVETYELSANVRLHWLLDGDHSFTPRKSSGRSEEDNWSEAVQTAAEFSSSIVSRGPLRVG